jgi:hypothetical protein
MRLILALGMTVGLTSASGSIVRAQDHHDAPTGARGAMVMGFDQARTAHHFLLYTDGGAIEVSVKDPADTANRDAIRSHLPHIGMMFADGDFSAPMLVHDSTNVPGTDVLIERKDAIHYRYVETPNGGRVDIVTSDPAALAAVHLFLKFQIAEHKTGDPTTISTR